MHNYPSHRRGYSVNRKGVGEKTKKVVKKASGTISFDWLIAKQEQDSKFIYQCNLAYKNIPERPSYQSSIIWSYLAHF